MPYSKHHGGILDKGGRGGGSGVVVGGRFPQVPKSWKRLPMGKVGFSGGDASPWNIDVYASLVPFMICRCALFFLAGYESIAQWSGH